jgi:hypothetical protein
VACAKPIPLAGSFGRAFGLTCACSECRPFSAAESIAYAFGGTFARSVYVSLPSGDACTFAIACTD